MTVYPIEPPEAEPEPAPGLDDLTAGETALAERKAGQSLATLGNEAYPQMGLLGALGWVLAMRTDAKLTYESYMSSRKPKDVSRELGLLDEEGDEGKADEDESSPD